MQSIPSSSNGDQGWRQKQQQEYRSLSSNRQDTVDDYEHIPIVMAAASLREDTLEPLQPSDAQVVIIDDPDDASRPSENTPLLLASTVLYDHDRQGVPIDDDDYDDDDHPDNSKQTKQAFFRDPWFAALWLLHFAALMYAWAVITPKGYTFGKTVNRTDIDHAIRDNNDDMPQEQLEQIDDFLDIAQDYLRVYPHRIFFYMIVPSIEIAVWITLMYTYFIMRTFTRLHVTMTLVGTVILAALLATFLLLTFPSLGVLIFVAVLILGPVIYFMHAVRSTIPFASVNLKVALSAISANFGIYFLALTFAQVGFVWFLFWLYTLVGTMTYLDNECKLPSDDDGSNATINSIAALWMNSPNQTIIQSEYGYADSTNDPACENNQGWVFFGFLLSLYWTSNILMNSLQVTVAGVMATWCYDKESAQWCCSSAIWSSLLRSFTSSFGSIALGSLLQAIITAVRTIIQRGGQGKHQQGPFGRRFTNPDANNDDIPCGGSICGCGLECIAISMEKILDHCNRWAFVYVGIYGYTYVDSGKQVFELFQSKGWTTIVTDQLVAYVLWFTTILMGILTGCVAILLDRVVTFGDNYLHSDEPDRSEGYDLNLSIHERSFIFGPIPSWPVLAFVNGLVVGIVVSSIMINVIQGAVNALIVCWADSPAQMAEVHPVHTQELADTWSEIFPDEYQYQYNDERGGRRHQAALVQAY